MTGKGRRLSTKFDLIRGFINEKCTKEWRTTARVSPTLLLFKWITKQSRKQCKNDDLFAGLELESGRTKEDCVTAARSSSSCCRAHIVCPGRPGLGFPSHAHHVPEPFDIDSCCCALCLWCAACVLFCDCGVFMSIVLHSMHNTKKMNVTLSVDW